jgi:hypothetical protein
MGSLLLCRYEVLSCAYALEIKIPTLRQAQGRLSRATGAREMGHPAVGTFLLFFFFLLEITASRLPRSLLGKEKGGALGSA